MWILKFPLPASNGSEPAIIQKIENILTLVAIIILKPQRKRKDSVLVKCKSKVHAELGLNSKN